MKISWLGFLVVLFCALSLNSVHFSHDPAQDFIAEPASYLAFDNATASHPHSHDDLEEDQNFGHMHGHNASDHSHDNAFTVSKPLKTSDLRIASLVSIPQNSLFFELSYGIDRPPRG